MGEKGARSNPETAVVAEGLVERWAGLGDVTSRKMFGGVGLFESGKMFGLLNSRGELYLKADDSNRTRFVDAASGQHGKMPYFAVPEEVLGDDEVLSEWVRASVEVAHRG